MKHEVIDHIEILDGKPVGSSVTSIIAKRDIAGIVIVDAGKMVLRHIGIGEHRLAESAHEAELEARTDVGGNSPEGRQVGNDSVRLKHHMLVDSVDIAAVAGLCVGRRNFKIAWRQWGEAGVSGKLCLRIQHVARVGEKDLRSREIDFLGHEYGNFRHWQEFDVNLDRDRLTRQERLAHRPENRDRFSQ